VARGGLVVGLTGGLGSGKSTAAAMFQRLGAHVLSADELGRQLMEPGTEVFRAIADRFGPSAVGADGRLDRAALARMAFGEGRVEDLNSIVHPATIRLQGELAEAILHENPGAIVVVESALIFETQHSVGWRERFGRLILVAAPDELKVARFVARSGAGDPAALEAEAKRRLSRMIPDESKAPQCDFVIVNDGTLNQLQLQVGQIWKQLTRPA
jgi:dephospho-CoA kinase